MITIVFIIVITAVVAVFSVQNAAPVSVTFLSWHFEASLAVIILLSILAGLIAGIIVLSSIQFARSSRKKAKQEKDNTSNNER